MHYDFYVASICNPTHRLLRRTLVLQQFYAANHESFQMSRRDISRVASIRMNDLNVPSERLMQPDTIINFEAMRSYGTLRTS